VGLAAALVGMIALSIVWRTNGAMPLTPMASNLELLRRYDPADGQIAVRYSPVARIPLADAVGLALAPNALPPDVVRRYGHALVVLLDGDAYMESSGAWVAGGSSARFLVADEDRTPRLFVRNVPAANPVTLSSGAWREVMVLAPREERAIDLPAGGARTLLEVTSAAGARPSDVEPGNGDRRLLGVWIETR
jgi:hypothetical protein